MATNLKVIGALALVLALIGGAIAWEISLWSECRQTNSWFYCLRVLNR
jgi:hypothetical protein